MSYIKFAGLASQWNFEYAKIYSDKLHEMGLFAKPVKVTGVFIVAYAYRSFTKNDIEQALDTLIKTQGEITTSGE